MLMQEIHWLEELFFSTDMWGLFGPMALIVAGFYLSKKNIALGMLMFFIDCVAVSQYATMLEETPSYYLQVFILIIGGLLTLIYPKFSR